MASAVDWQTLSNIGTAAAGGAALATALSLSAIWLLRRRREARGRLSVRVERPANEVFQLIVEYRPKSLSQAHFVWVGSLGSNPIYLLPKLHEGLPEDACDDLITGFRWPKQSGQWTYQRLRRVSQSEFLRAVFRIVPDSTDAAGWMHVRVCTRGPRTRTVLRRRIPVSLID